MRVILLAALACAAIAVGAWYAVGTLDLSSANRTASPSVRLD